MIATAALHVYVDGQERGTAIGPGFIGGIDNIHIYARGSSLEVAHLAGLATTPTSTATSCL